MFDPEQFRNIAGDILRRGSRPVHCRTAIGRAYYGAFLVARELLLPHFAVPRSDDVHEAVTRLLGRSGRSELKRIGQQLRDLRRMRNKADYDMNYLPVE